MPFTLTMPKLSPTMEEGTIVKWRIVEGDNIASGDVLLEVATDKATVEHSALDEGYLRKILVKEGEGAIVNQPIAIFTETQDESIEGYEPEGDLPPEPEEKAATSEGEVKEEKKVTTLPSKGGLAEPIFTPAPPLEGYRFSGATQPIKGRLPVSPLARKLAEEKGVDLATVKGSGPHGRIMSRDLPTGQPAAKVSFSRKYPPSIPPGSYEEEAPAQMQKVAGKRLQQAKTFIPHFYVTQQMDAEPMVTIREQLKAGGVRVTFNDFIVRATALALREHPQVNSGFDTQTHSLIRFKTIDLSIAVSLPNGLITPIIRLADHKNLGEISSEVRLLVKRAKEGKLSPEEFTGGSFTLSNLGMFGVRDFISIINPPQAAILAVGGIADQPVVKEGKVVPGKILSVTLSADHRVLDGAEGARFLATLQGFIESPSLLLV